MAARNTTSNARKATQTTQASQASQEATKTTRKPRADYKVKDVKRVNKSVAFPTGSTRTSTQLSPYTPLIDSLIDGSNPYVVFEAIQDDAEFTSFGNTLRNIAKSRHNQRLQVVNIKVDSPSTPSGVYVRATGEIQSRNGKVEKEVATPVKATRTRKTTR